MNRPIERIRESYNQNLRPGEVNELAETDGVAAETNHSELCLEKLEAAAAVGGLEQEGATESNHQLFEIEKRCSDKLESADCCERQDAEALVVVSMCKGNLNELPTDALSDGRHHQRQHGGDTSNGFDPLSQIQPMPFLPSNERIEPRAHISLGVGAHRVDGIPGQHWLLAPPARSTTERRGNEDVDERALQGFLAEEGVADEIPEAEHDHLPVLEEAQVAPIPKRNSSSVETKNWIILILLLVILVGLAALIIWVVLSQPNDNGRDEMAMPQQTSENLNPAATMGLPFQDDLPTATLQAIRDYPESAEARANWWMVKDPYLQNYDKVRQRQRFGMATLYFATNGDKWTNKDNWLSYNISECQWFSRATDEPVCDDLESIFTLDLHANNLSGTLPNDFWFIEPHHLNLANNSIGGQLPPFPSNSEHLEALILSNNNFTGGLTAEAGVLFDKLRVVRIDGNSLQEIHKDSGVYRLLPKLQVLDYSNNKYTNPFSPNVKYLTDLRYFRGVNNDKRGSLVTELGLLTRLEVFDFSLNTRMTGTVPSELGLLTNLVHFNLADAQLEGTLPEELCQREEQGLLQVFVNCSSCHCL